MNSEADQSGSTYPCYPFSAMTRNLDLTLNAMEILENSKHASNHFRECHFFVCNGKKKLALRGRNKSESKGSVEVAWWTIPFISQI